MESGLDIVQFASKRVNTWQVSSLVVSCKDIFLVDCSIPGPFAHGGNHLLSGDEVYYYCYLGYACNGW